MRLTESALSPKTKGPPLQRSSDRSAQHEEKVMDRDGINVDFCLPAVPSLLLPSVLCKCNYVLIFVFVAVASPSGNFRSERQARLST